MNQEVIDEYAENMRNGTEFPPITVFHDGHGMFYYLADGFHRFEAVKRLRKRTIKAEVRPGEKRDAIIHALGANASHGLRRTNADKRRAVEMALKLAAVEGNDWSDREIARRCRVDHRTVANMRKELSGEIPQIDNSIRKVTRGGKTYIQNTGNIGRRKQKDSTDEEDYRDLIHAIEEGEVDLADVPVRIDFQPPAENEYITGVRRRVDSADSQQTLIDIIVEIWELLDDKGRSYAKSMIDLVEFVERGNKGREEIMSEIQASRLSSSKPSRTETWTP
jgi:hypothetical protein